jgi:RND family efflux transporter MFP subunit
VPPPPPTVTVQAPDVREITTFEEFTGRAEAVDTVEVRARVKGFLETIAFEPSQIVRAGDPDDPEDPGDLLFEIEDSPYQAAVDSAEAALAQAQAAEGLAAVTLERGLAAWEQGAVTEIEKKELEAQLDAAKAAVRAAQAALDTAKIDLSYTRIYAPLSGRISRELVDVGNLVGSGESTLLTVIVADDPIYVYFNINERAVLKYLTERPRDTAAREDRLALQLRLVDGSMYPLEGLADFADNRIDSSTGMLQVRAVFPNPDSKLFPGMFVRALVPDETGERMLIPEVALLRDLAGAYVLVADEQSIVQRRDVVLGPQVDKERVITSGLEPTDRVIVNGIQRAIPGNPVTAEEAPPPGEEPAAPEPPAAEPSEGGDEESEKTGEDG